MAHDNDAAYLGTFDNGEGAWLTTADRRRHLYVIGRIWRRQDQRCSKTSCSMT